jgi:hypothetical protein
VEVKEGQKFVVSYARDLPDAISFTVRGVTESGVYITGSERSPGNLIPHALFGKLYCPDTRCPSPGIAKR